MGSILEEFSKLIFYIDIKLNLYNKGFKKKNGLTAPKKDQERG